MIVPTNSSNTPLPASKDDTFSALSEGGISLEGLSLAQKETFNLARDARHGDNVLDKVLLNVVQPPALVLFTLLDTGRMSPEVPLPHAQNAYDTIADTRDTGAADGLTGSTSDPGSKSVKPGSGFAQHNGAVAAGHTAAADVATSTSTTQSSSGAAPAPTA